MNIETEESSPESEEEPFVSEQNNSFELVELIPLSVGIQTEPPALVSSSTQSLLLSRSRYSFSDRAAKI